MLESCLENKIIYEFLTLYDHSFWKKLIPSLLEIAILNLKSSFNTLLFSEKDINNIIRDLKIKQNISHNFNIKPKSIQEKNKDKEKKNILYYKPFTESKTLDGWDDHDNSNNHICCHSDKRKYKHVHSKIKNLIDNDKINYYYTNRENNLINNYNFNPRKRINYAISYDKNLTPEIIQRTTFKISKKGGKKIVQKMTQEEYEKKFKDDSQDNNRNSNEKIKTKKLFHSQGPNKIKNIDISGNNLSPYKNINSYYYSNINIKNISPKLKNQSERRNNLYHYKIKYNNQKNNTNNILIKNSKVSNYENNKNNLKNNILEVNANSLKDFGKHYFRSQNNTNKKKINHFKIIKNNNFNNTTNYTREDRNYINNTYNNKNDFHLNRNSNYHKNSYLDIDKDRDSDSDFIGIEKIYEKKVDELEKNILNTYNNYLRNLKIINGKNLNRQNNNPAINRLKVNTINLKEYALKKKKKNKNFKKNKINEYNYAESLIGNRTEINDEKKEKTINKKEKKSYDVNNENGSLS